VLPGSECSAGDQQLDRIRVLGGRLVARVQFGEEGSAAYEIDRTPVVWVDQ
jgi:hypothetical protein